MHELTLDGYSLEDLVTNPLINMFLGGNPHEHEKNIHRNTAQRAT